MSFLKRVRGPILTGIALFLYLSGVAAFRAMLLQKREPLVRILLIHHIKDTSRFERMVRHLKRNYNPISYDDLRAERFHRTRINVLLTMDDGYASWYEDGLPVLERHSVPAVFFVPSGFIECSGDDNEIRRYCKEHLRLSWTSPPLSLEMLTQCSKHRLIEVGGHTWSHPFLSLVSEEKSESEIVQDKRWLEDKTGKEVSAFAYPYGNYNRAVKGMVRAAGYEYGMTTRSDFFRTASDPYAVPRSNHGTVNQFVLSMWVWGAYDLAEMLVRKARYFRPGNH